MKNFTLAAIVLLFIACNKDKDSDTSPSGNNPNNPSIPTIDGGKSYFSFDDSSATTWYAATLERSVNGNSVYMKATNTIGEVIEIQTQNLTGESKVPVGAGVGYLAFTNKDNETFDTRIGGAGNVFYSRLDQERIEGTFLFPLVQSIQNNFMEINNGKFGFDLPLNSSLVLYNILDNWDNYLFVEKPLITVSGSTQYISGPKTPFTLDVTNNGAGNIDPASVAYSGTSGDSYSFILDLSNEKKNNLVNFNVELKYDTTVVGSGAQSFSILPIFGTYKLLPLNGAPSNSSTIFIEAITDQPGKFYKVSGSMFGKTLIFEDDGTGQIECYDTFQHLGETFNNIYFYDDSQTVIHMAIHSSNSHFFYQLVRQSA